MPELAAYDIMVPRADDSVSFLRITPGFSKKNGIICRG